MTKLPREKPEHRGGKETFKVTSNDDEPTKTVKVKSWEVFENYTPIEAHEDVHGQTRLPSSETNSFRYVFSCDDGAVAFPRPHPKDHQPVRRCSLQTTCAATLARAGNCREGDPTNA
jgi:hypothetical protein